jgi:hypothetical protein
VSLRTHCERAKEDVLSGPRREGFEGGAGEEVALHGVDAKVAEGVHLRFAFDALGDDADVELAADLDDGFDDGSAGGTLVDVLSEGTVDLEDVGLELGEEGEAGVAVPKSSMATRRPWERYSFMMLRRWSWS